MVTNEFSMPPPKFIVYQVSYYSNGGFHSKEV